MKPRKCTYPNCLCGTWCAKEGKRRNLTVKLDAKTDRLVAIPMPKREVKKKAAPLPS